MLFTVHGNISRITQDSYDQLVQRAKEFIEKNVNYKDLTLVETPVKFNAYDKARKISISIDKAQDFLSVSLNIYPNACLKAESFGPLSIADVKALLDESEVHENIYRINENGQLYFFVDASKYTDRFSAVILGKKGHVKKLVQEKLTGVVSDLVYNVSMYGKDQPLEKFLAERSYRENVPYSDLLPFIEEAHPGFTEALRKVQANAKQEEINYYRREINLTIHKINTFGQSVIDIILGDVKLENLIKYLVETVNKVGGDEEPVVNGLFSDQYKRLYFEEKHRQEEIHAGRTVAMDA